MVKYLRYIALGLGLGLCSCSTFQPSVDRKPPPAAVTGGISEAEEKKAKALLDEGDRAYSLKLYAEAVDKAQAMLAKYPKSSLVPEAIYLTARSRFDLGQNDLAMQNAQKLVQQFPQSNKLALAKKLIGDCYLAGQDYIKAGQQYLEGLQAAKSSDEKEQIRLPLAALVEENLQIGEVRILFKKYSSSEMAPALGLRLGRMELDAKNAEDGQKILQELVKKYSGTPEAEQAAALLAQLREASAPTPAALEAPRIGLLAPLKGKYSEYGQAVKEGVELALNEHNQKAASKVKLFAEDTQGDMIEAIAAAAKLADSTKVLVIIGEVLSGPTIAAAGVANAKQVPLLSPTAGEERIASIGPFVFQLTQSTSWQGASMASHAAKKLGLSSLGVLFPNESSAEATAKAFREQAEKEGAKVLVYEDYEPGTTDFKAQIEKLRASKIQALFIPAPPTDIVMIAPQLAYNQIKVQLLGHEAWADPKVLSQGEVYVEGAIFATLSPSSGQAQAAQAFEQAYKKRHSKSPPKLAIQGYDAARLVLEALKQNPAAPDELRRALLATGSFTKGAAGQISYGKMGVQPKAQFKAIRNKKLVELE